MSDHLHEFLVVFTIATIVFFVVRNIGQQLLGPADFVRQRNIWLAFTAFGFLVGNFWLFIVVALACIFLVWPKEPVKLALFTLLLLVLPAVNVDIPGLGLFNRLVQINIPILLSIAILLPAIIWYRKSPSRVGVRADLLMVAYVGVSILLMLRETTFTDSLRRAFLLCFSIYIPYLAFSRLINSSRDIYYVIAAFVLPLLALSAIGAFESVNIWYLYDDLRDSWSKGGLWMSQIDVGVSQRSGFARALTTSSQPIAFGFAVMVAIGFLLALPRSSLTNWQWTLCFSLLFVGLLSSLSRGPWVGASILYVVYSATRPGKVKHILFAVGSIVLLVVVADMVVPGGVIETLPFIGEAQQENVLYRQRLITNALEVIKEKPLLGQPPAEYLKHPNMQKMIQGSGIIDIVNTYISVTLRSGILGLSLFCGFFLSVLISLWKALSSLPPSEMETKQTGGALFATLLAILATIATVGPIGHIQFIMFTVAGLCVGYNRIIHGRMRELEDAIQPSPKIYE